jgi:hypothetical protein
MYLVVQKELIRLKLDEQEKKLIKSKTGGK